MNGKRFFLDTNAIIGVLKGNQEVLDIISQADSVETSIINQLEFLSYPNLSDSDQLLFKSLISRVDVIDLKTSQNQLIESILRIRRQYSLKLPDAIVAATAIFNQAALITADKDFQKVKELKLISFNS